MTTASNWLLNWAIGYSTPYLVNNNPGSPPQGVDLKSKIFFIWGGCCVICIAFGKTSAISRVKFKLKLVQCIL